METIQLKLQWKVMRIAIRKAVRSIPRQSRKPKFSDELIVKMFFWSVAHDRPRYWACQRESYNRIMRPRKLPSVSQFCKRLNTEHICHIIYRVHELLSGLDEEIELAFIDGKALPVSESSKDPDVRSGYGNGKFSRGYKLHALGDSFSRIRSFCVRSMNEGEPTVAREALVKYISAGATVLADGNYDGKKLYTAVAEQHAFLFTHQKKNKRTEAAFANTTPERRAAMEFWRDHPKKAKIIYGLRGAIERIFSALSCYGGGLSPLPAWVRRRSRVTAWVTAKVALYNARVLIRICAS